MYPDVRLHDSAALEEIQLYAEVLVAASGASQQLTAEEIDQLLGIAAAAPNRVRLRSSIVGPRRSGARRSDR